METIYINGFCGVGKTMISKLLSSRKELLNLDVNESVEKLANKKIVDIFQTDGETHFKKLEKEVIKKQVKQGMIVSLNAKTVNDEENLEIIKRTGRVIYLKAKPETIYNNIKEEYYLTPYFNNDFSVFTIEKQLNELESSYNYAMNYTIDVDNKTINDVFKETLAVYNYINKVKCHIFIK